MWNFLREKNKFFVCFYFLGCCEDYRKNVLPTRSFGTFGYQRKKSFKSGTAK
jgi:hypothetical protein